MKLRKSISILLTFAMTLSIVFASVGSVSAATNRLATRTLWGPGDYELISLSDYSTVTGVSAKSSNTAVGRITKDTWTDEKNHKIVDFYLKAKSLGKTTVTYVYKKNGKKYTAKGTYVVKKYPKAIKSLSLNGTQYKIRKSRYFGFEKRGYGRKTSARVKIVPAKGWKFTYTEYYMGNSNDDFINKRIKGSTLKSGTTIKFPTKYDYMGVFISLVNAKGEAFYYSIDIDRHK